jgi:hypothetical protein
MSDTGSRGATGRPASPRPRTQPALPEARLLYGHFWLQVERYPRPEEAEGLARSAIMELRSWSLSLSLSPHGEHWALYVDWRASAPSPRRSGS